MEIKTLAQILEENPDSANKPSDYRKRKAPKDRQIKKQKQQLRAPIISTRSSTHSFAVSDDLDTAKPWETEAEEKSSDSKNTERQNKHHSPKRQKQKIFHPASPYQPKIESTPPVKEINPNSIKNLLAQVKAEGSASSNDTVTSQAEVETIQRKHCETDALSRLDNLPAALKAYLKTPEQRQAEKEAIKANSRLRWLAFYYLSRREHSAGELRQKLIDKEQDPVKIDELLAEFAEKGYQSDYRTALMLIREGIRKRYGRVRIKNDFYKRKVAMPSNIDELIDMAMDDNEEFADVLSDNDLVEGVDWLRLAVEARVKKYGDAIPTEPKEKAKQLRFLQYRGFKPDICFQAIGFNLESLDSRF